MKEDYHNFRLMKAVVVVGAITSGWKFNGLEMLMLKNSLKVLFLFLRGVWRRERKEFGKYDYNLFEYAIISRAFYRFLTKLERR